MSNLEMDVLLQNQTLIRFCLELPTKYVRMSMYGWMGQSAKGREAFWVGPHFICFHSNQVKLNPIKLSSLCLFLIILPITTVTSLSDLPSDERVVQETQTTKIGTVPSGVYDPCMVTFVTIPI